VPGTGSNSKRSKKADKKAELKAQRENDKLQRGRLKRAPRFLLLCGLPGCGKSTFAEGLCGELALKFGGGGGGGVGGGGGGGVGGGVGGSGKGQSRQPHKGGSKGGWVRVCQDELGSRDACEVEVVRLLKKGHHVVRQ
jgi:hypothetical protein